MDEKDVLVEKLKYNQYILNKCKELTFKYQEEWKLNITPNQHIDIDNNIVNLFKMVQESLPESTEEYDEKKFEPDIEPVVDFGYIYEFESLCDDIFNCADLSEDQIERFNISYGIWNSTLDIWFNYKYGYYLEELESELWEKRSGIFRIISGE